MKYLLGTVTAVIIFFIGFWTGSNHESSELKSQGVLISSGPQLEDVQQITAGYVRTHVAANYEECASLFANDAIYMIPGKSPLIGRDNIKEYLKQSFTGRTYEILEMAEPAEEAIYFGDYVAARGIGIEKVLNADSTIEEFPYKWMVLARKTSDGNWETVWDIYNDDE